jgi:hypothetical protein
MTTKANVAPIFIWRIIFVTAVLAGLFGMLILRLVRPVLAHMSTQT